MRTNTRTFRTLAATLAGGLIIAGGVLVTSAPAVAAVPGTQTFTSASDTAWVVPVGVTQVTYRVVGGEGGDGGQILPNNGGAGGTAGTITGTLTGLTAGQTLHIWAGQTGGDGGILFNANGSGGAGYRTGGAGANGGTALALPGGGGGGSSAIAVGAATPFVIAAGGGGGGGRGGITPLCVGRDGGDAGQAGLSANSAGCNNVQTGGAAGIVANVANNGSAATQPAGLNIIGASGGSGGGGAGGGAAGTTQTGNNPLTPRNNGGAGGGGGASLVPGTATFTIDGAETGNGYVQLDWLVEYPTTTVLTVDDSTPVIGQDITFTAVVTNTLTTDNPTGTVDFGVTGCNAQSLTLGVPAAGQSTATCIFSAGPVGPHSYHAEYVATANSLFASSDSANIEVVVGKGDTTTLLAISDLTPVVGEQFSGTATVTVVAPADAPLSGTVQFYLDDVAEGAPVALVGNQAQLNFTVPDAGPHTIKAVYSGNDDLNGSEDSEDINVLKGDTTTTLGLSPNPAVTGQTVTATATIAVVAPAVATIDGTVEFFLDGVSLGSSPVVAGVATMNFSAGAVGDGSKAVTAFYSGNDNLNGSNDAEDLTVNKGNTTTTLTLDPTSVIVGGDIEATASIVVDAPAVAVIDGTVEFFVDGVSQGTAPVVAGVAVLTFPSGPVGDGTKTVTAVYSGDPDLNGSEDTADYDVLQGDTTTTVVLDPTQVVIGGNVKATATVALVAPADAPIDGFVDFWIGSNYMGTSALDPVTHTAEYTFPANQVGTFDITAIYTGNDDLRGSESDPAQLTVSSKPLPSTGGGDNAIWIAGGAGLLLIGGLGVLLITRRRQEA